ncbi:MAG: cobyric acid synthase [Clostridiales bacterium]|nr:cobyric acid synthase [Clostridiales bacterium]MDY4060038.1 cobyric acid synthase [Anaerovoracaceae bacterium]
MGKKARKMMVLGTCSNSGKSFIVAGICRILKNKGFKVAPYKSQNMALNSFITEDGLEMGRAQVVQAEAAGIKPDVRMNPILLKPNSDTGSQIILHGEVYGNYTASSYYEKKDFFEKEAIKALEELEEDFDYIIMEGAGSASEINLKDKDIVNMGLAEKVDAPVIIVGDIDRGGVFGALAGTMLLFDEREKDLVKGVIINKFRGNLDILKPGLDMIEDIIQRPVLGVVPFMKVDIDDEDSLAMKDRSGKSHNLIDIVVIRTPRISNFTDFNALEHMEGVGVRYVETPKDIGNPDLIILPGTKSTMGDLRWLRESGMETRIQKHASRGKPIIGICGGYQMLGKRLKDEFGVEGGGEMKGIGLLPHSTEFTKDKVRKAQVGKLEDVDGIFADLSGLEYEGYEIHMGISPGFGNIINEGNVYGTYIHGIFDRGEISGAIICALMKAKGINTGDIEAMDMEEYKEKQYEILGTNLEKALDTNRLIEILGGK